MPFYYKLDEFNETDKRTAERLLALKQQLDADIPKRTLEDNFLLATWNIREFDSESYGERGNECIYYIAEIISRFDLVAVQEVREDLRALDRVLDYLGKWWDYIVTDVTEGKPGNRERMAFVYDTRKVRFAHQAGEVTIPPRKATKDGKTTVYEPADQLYRTPFLCSFQCGWFSFNLCTVHIVYGEGVADDPNRIKEIGLIARFLADRAKEPYHWSKNFIILGDFNIFAPEDETMTQLESNGFVFLDALKKLPSNAAKGKHYDQIGYILEKPELQAPTRGGVFDFYQTVYCDHDEAVYATAMGDAYLKTSKGKARDAKGKTSYYKTYWRTFQMSDHLPMWVEFKIDHGVEYLKFKAGQV